MAPTFKAVIPFTDATEIYTQRTYEFDTSVLSGAGLAAGDLVVAVGIKWWTNAQMTTETDTGITMTQVSGMGQTGVGGGYWGFNGLTAWQMYGTVNGNILLDNSGLVTATSGIAADTGTITVSTNSVSPPDLAFVALAIYSDANTADAGYNGQPFVWVPTSEDPSSLDPLSGDGSMPLDFYSGWAPGSGSDFAFFEVCAHVAMEHPTDWTDGWNVDDESIFTDVTTGAHLQAEGADSYWIHDNGPGTSSPAGTWTVDDFSTGGTGGIDARTGVGNSVPFAVWLDDGVPEGPPDTGGGGDAEPFEFTNRWPLMGPALMTSPAQGADLLERHDQELEEHFATHGCGDFEYTFRWATFHHEFLAAAAGDPTRMQRVIDILERRDQELEEASAHQGEGTGQTNDGSCAINLTHRWREIMPRIAAGSAEAWELLERRDQEIEQARSACVCGDGGSSSS